MAANPAKPSASTPSDAGLMPPTSRRMTRSGGTRASCSTGGRPNATINVSPSPRPNSTGHTLAAGKATLSKLPSSSTNTWCTAKPSTTPHTLANTPTARNSSVNVQAMVRWLWPSTRNMAQSSRWRWAKPRAAMATATALRSAANKATRFKNFSARPKVCDISGRPDSSDSSRPPRAWPASSSVCAQVPKRRTASSAPTTAKRQLMRLAG